MNKARLRWMENEFDRIFDSLEPEIREDADRLDYRLRVVWNEAMACGVSREIAEKKMRERLIGLIREFGEGGHGQAHHSRGTA